MRASWFVIAEVCFPGRARELLGQQRHQRHYVGLLDHLRALRLRVAEHNIDRYFAIGVQREINRFQLVVAGKLVVEACSWIETGDDAFDGIAPVRKLRFVQRKPFNQCREAFGPMSLQQLNGLKPTRDVPARHHVSKGVVVDILVVFIRPDHVPYMPFAIWLQHRARCPEARRLQQNLRTSIEKERIVARRAPILPQGIGDIRADVMLHPTGQDVDHLAIGAHHLVGRGLLAGVCRFPGVERALVAHCGCFGARAGHRLR